VRAVIQAAGRVWRHRTYRGGLPNVAILGRSAIIMQTRKLARPGVETISHKDTGIPRVSLDAFGERLFADLVGDGTFDRIDAGAMLGDGDVPLREKEQDLLSRMVALTGDYGALGDYIRRSTARLNRRITRSRKFRRSDTRDILYFQNGEGPDDWQWLVDLAPGTRHSDPRPATKHRLSIGERGEPHLVFPSLDALSWADRPGGTEAVTASDRRNLMRVQVPDYDEEVEPTMTYREWTGFTRGKPDDLLQPFGKTQTEQYDSKNAEKEC
jgi:CRISPR-associated endonuclease/helicase Cas3